MKLKKRSLHINLQQNIPITDIKKTLGHQMCQLTTLGCNLNEMLVLGKKNERKTSS
jgi:hypothetical protein